MARYNLGEFQRAVRDNHDGWLTRDEKWTAFILASHGSTDGLNVHRSQELLALDLAVSESSVWRALKGLRDKGVIIRTAQGNKRQGLSDVYKLIPPPDWPHDQSSHRRVIDAPETLISRQPDEPNTSLNIILDTDQSSHRRVMGVAEDTNTSNLPALDPYSRAVSTQTHGNDAITYPETIGDGTCFIPGCSYSYPRAHTANIKGVTTFIRNHFRSKHPGIPIPRVVPMPAASTVRAPVSKPVPARAPRPHAPAQRKFSTWTCEQCGKVSSEMNSADKTMCKSCKRKIEGK